MRFERAHGAMIQWIYVYASMRFCRVGTRVDGHAIVLNVVGADV